MTILHQTCTLVVKQQVEIMIKHKIIFSARWISSNETSVTRVWARFLALEASKHMVVKILWSLYSPELK